MCRFWALTEYVNTALTKLGFDGIRKYGIDEGSLFVSSMCQPIEELARLCVETLLKKRQGTVVPTLSLLPVTYGYGGTTRRES